MKPNDIETLTKKLLKKHNHPNTYTFSKSLSESLLVQKRGNIPLSILRPSIIGASVKEPYEGWIDAVSAASAIYFCAGIGILSVLPGDVNAITDQVPVDIVSNAVIVVTAKHLKNDYKVYHVVNKYF
jgi:alcohol-forming fatty acyl-CoA reductase